MGSGHCTLRLFLTRLAGNQAKGREAGGLEGRCSDQAALQTQRDAQESIALEVHGGVRSADAHGDGPPAGALAERRRYEATDVAAVVLDDLVAELLGAEPLRAEAVRQPAALVVRRGLGRILGDLQIRPALRALPGVADPFRVEDAADVLTYPAACRRVQRADRLTVVLQDQRCGGIHRRRRARALERVSAVALIRRVIAHVPGPVARRRLTPRRIRAGGDRVRA